MKKPKKALLVLGLLALSSFLFWFVSNPSSHLVRQTILKTNQLDSMAVAKPWFASQGLVLMFVDAQKYSPTALAKQIAATGAAAVVMDSTVAIKRFSGNGTRCLDAQRIAEPLQRLADWANVSDGRRLIAGIGDGALLAFLAATTQPANNTDYLSVGFSAELPNAISVCPPFTSASQGQKTVLVPPAGLTIHWRSVWADQPATDTAVFVRQLSGITTDIAAYDSALDQLTIKEIYALMKKNGNPSSTMPTVEVLAENPKPTVTIFYSGDGGWRDLDRTVAEELVKLNYPVVGVDVLRYFWEYKSPEQAAADLTKLMVYYRKTWGAENFVLAGYSFGADILPAVFNRLSPQDQANIQLLVLLAPAERASFEIHVSGWLGQDSGELAVAPEVAVIPKNKLLCIYGKDERDERGCTALDNSAAEVVELPGGHHFDQDYPKLTRRILAVYHSHGID